MDKEMYIAIPSRSRADKVKTVESIPPKWRSRTFLYVPKNQEREYHGKYGKDFHVCGVSVPGIHKVRHKICTDFRGDIVLMLDDDMYFYKRPNMALPKLERCNHKDMNEMLEAIWRDAHEFWAVAISARQGNNHVSDEFVDVGRMNNAYAIDTDKYFEADEDFSRLKVMEDFDVTLGMLTQGYPNRIYYRWAWNQTGSGADGGCSDYRTGDVQTKCAHLLHKRFPDYVKVVEKKSKSGWEGMETRTDVRIQWKKAYNENV